MLRFYLRGKRLRVAFPVIILIAITCVGAFASNAAGGGVIDSLPRVLVGLIIILLAAKLGGDLSVRIGQPAVLGELIFGIVIGNLSLAGFHAFDFIKTDPSIWLLAELGVIILLFQVGLESDLDEMVRLGASSLLVATLGVVAPFFLGWAVAAAFLPGDSVYVHVFIGATLCATSVGITARVLRDLGKAQTPEAQVILGAAVIDDVQGLIILAAVIGIINSASSGAALSSTAILIIVLKATIFLAGALIIGRWLSPRLFQAVSRLKAADLLLTTALAVCFGLAYAAWRVGLAPIVGAFAAGLILDEVHWGNFPESETHSVEELIAPIAALLVPVFFVRMGAIVDLRAFGSTSVLAFAAVLTLAAIAGKQVCGLGVLHKGLDRLTVGIGMIPRGEVGLIFAANGLALTLAGRRVISDATYAAIVAMVVVTTMLAPPALKWSLARRERKVARATGSQAPPSDNNSLD